MADQNQNPAPGPVAPTNVVGEDSAPVTTLALGEEHTVTNLVGEQPVFQAHFAAFVPVAKTPTTGVVGEAGNSFAFAPAAAAAPAAPTTAITTNVAGEEGPTMMPAGAEGPPTHFANGAETPTTSAIGEEGVTTFIFGEEGPTIVPAGAEGPPTHIVPGLEAPTTYAIGEEGPTTNIVGEGPPTIFPAGAEGPTTFIFGEEGPTTFQAAAETPPTATFIGAEGPTFRAPAAEGPTIAQAAAEDPYPVFAAAAVGAAPSLGNAPTPFGYFSPLAAAPSVASAPEDLDDFVGRIFSGVSLKVTAGISGTNGAAIDIDQLQQSGVISVQEADALQRLMVENTSSIAEFLSRAKTPQYDALSPRNAGPFVKTLLSSLANIAATQARSPASKSGFAPLAKPGGLGSAAAAGCLAGANLGTRIIPPANPYGLAGTAAAAAVGCLVGAGIMAAGAAADRSAPASAPTSSTATGAGDLAGGPGDAGGGCFVADTLVLMGDGSTRAIGHLAIGDEIWTVPEHEHLANTVSTGSRATVQEVHRHQGQYQIFEVDELQVTANHPWAVVLNGKSGFAATSELDARLELRTCSATHTALKRASKATMIERVAGEVFNLKTTARTFAVGKTPDGPFYLVHNKDDSKLDEEKTAIA